MCFHRIIGNPLRILDEGVPTLDELVVDGRLDRHEVIPCREMSDERAGIEPGKLLLPHREGHHRNVGSLDALITKLLIERHVRITVDRRYDRRLLACRSELLDLADDGLPVGMPERR